MVKRVCVLLVLSFLVTGILFGLPNLKTPIAEASSVYDKKILGISVVGNHYWRYGSRPTDLTNPAWGHASFFYDNPSTTDVDEGADKKGAYFKTPVIYVPYDYFVDEPMDTGVFVPNSAHPEWQRKYDLGIAKYTAILNDVQSWQPEHIGVVFKQRVQNPPDSWTGWQATDKNGVKLLPADSPLSQVALGLDNNNWNFAVTKFAKTFGNIVDYYEIWDEPGFDSVADARLYSFNGTHQPIRLFGSCTTDYPHALELANTAIKNNDKTGLNDVICGSLLKYVAVAAPDYTGDYETNGNAYRDSSYEYYKTLKSELNCSSIGVHFFEKAYEPTKIGSNVYVSAYNYLRTLFADDARPIYVTSFGWAWASQPHEQGGYHPNPDPANGYDDAHADQVISPTGGMGLDGLFDAGCPMAWYWADLNYDGPIDSSQSPQTYYGMGNTYYNGSTWVLDCHFTWYRYMDWIKQTFAYTWYFAEGYTGSGFEEFISLFNPCPQPVQSTVTFYYDKLRHDHSISVAGNSRTTINVAQYVPPGKEVSTRITANALLIAERPMYFTYNGQWGGSANGGHCVVGATTRSTSYYFAEGSTRNGFDEYICLFNPGSVTANVTITYRYAGGPKQQTVSVPVNGRVTVSPRGAQVPADKDVATRITSDYPIVAERPMYFTYNGSWGGVANGGDCVVGTTTASVSYYFAEGTTRSGFDEYISLFNPHSVPATVTATYRYAGGTKQQVVSLPAYSRATVQPRGLVPENTDVATRITSDLAIVAERPMYFAYSGSWGGVANGGHCVVGATGGSTSYYFAEGTTRSGFDEYISLFNAGSVTRTVNITYRYAGGSKQQTVSVPVNGRVTVDPRGAQVPAGKDVAVMITSNYAIVAERSMYFTYNGSWGGVANGGSCVVGISP